MRAAIDAGFSRAFKTVIDTHVTVLVSGLILYQFGTGPVKGFAVTLMIGIAVEPVHRGVLHAAALRPDLHGPAQAGDAVHMIELFRDPNFDFIGRRRWAYVISILFILAGLGSMVAKGGLRYGIDFSGGTLIQVRFEKPVAVDRIRHALETVQLGESVIQEFGDTREYLLRLPLASTVLARR